MELNKKMIIIQKEQKIMIAIEATVLMILTLVFQIDNLFFVMAAVVFAAGIIVVIFYELINEAWVAARIQEYYNSVPEEQDTEPVTIDVIS
ncbi:MAG: hypothetical protein PHW62_00490 [Candidatus Ratteibacteria bacterium]|nr:hypothetical protein [Candidatus Ratteibacteria bacterium]